jgi:Zn-dependent peptidase ImmA (M78 family)/DNA-binding XRE family transcriptional regulator
MKRSIYLKTNPGVLKWARESLAISRTKAAEGIQITVSRLEQIENGEKYPSLDEIKLMSKTYKRTIATLLLQQIPEERPLPKDRRTVNSEDVGKFTQRTIMAVRKARALASSLIELKAEAGLTITGFSHTASLTEPAHVKGNKLRKELDIDEFKGFENDNDFLDACIERVENMGIAVFQLSLNQDNLRGFSLVDEPLPIIVIKRGEPASSKVFTLFHELGHILLRDGGLCDIRFGDNDQGIEKWCNAFAAEVLVPAQELMMMDIVQTYAGKNQKIWERKDLIELSNHFHVGLLTILRRLLDNGRTTPDFYRDKHEKWNKPTFGRSTNNEGRNIPKEVIKEKGRTYIRLAFNAFDQKKIDLKDLSDFIGVKLSYIPKTRQFLKA